MKPTPLFEIVLILLAEFMLSPSLMYIALLREKTENSKLHCSNFAVVIL